MIQIRKVRQNEILDFEKLTFMKHRPLLQQSIEDPAVIAIAAEFEGQPVGLSLVQYSDYSKHAVILSLFITSEFRRRGIGKRLIKKQKKC